MPYIINKEDLMGLRTELENSVAELQTIWDDKQYKYFCEKYADQLLYDLRNMEDNLDEYIYRIYNLQMKIESL